METYRAEKLFDEYLDEVNNEVKICGFNYQPSDVFKNTDPIGYRSYFMDWIDSEVVEGFIELAETIGVGSDKNHAADVIDFHTLVKRVR